MLTSSAKAKGRRLQQLVRDRLREIGKDFGLVAGDVNSTGMGQTGVDVLLSPAAHKVFPFDIECKMRESLVVPTVFYEHYDAYASRATLKLLIHSRNRLPEPLVTMRLCDFLTIYTALISKGTDEQGNRPPLPTPSV